MSDNEAQSYLLIGTVTKDLLADGQTTTGGTVTYAATVAKNLGWRPVIVTRATPEFVPPAHLVDVDWRILPSPETTTFRNDYYPEGRVQTIGPIASVIGPDDIPADCRDASLVHLCPLAQDVTPEITGDFDRSCLFSTPQGWLRQWDEQGIVSLGGWRKMETILPRLHAAVVSIEDVEHNEAIIEAWTPLIPILVVTRGELGCTVFHRGQRLDVPPRSSQPVDPTGAGDVFATAFFIRLHETGDVRQAAYFANVTASMAIERPGVSGTPNRIEIESYIAQYPMVAPI